MPSFDEIAAGIGLKSKSGVHRLVCGLEQRGVIRRLRGKRRAIEFTAPDNMDPFSFLSPTVAAVVLKYAKDHIMLPKDVIAHCVAQWAYQQAIDRGAA
jgi:SOS-response transcriptional repressor LexA